MFRFILKLHSVWIGLFPRAFRKDFQDELQGVFGDVLAEASQKGFWATLAVALREFAELLVNALDEHLIHFRRSGFMLQSIRILYRPVGRIIRNIAFFEIAVVLIVSLLGQLGKWRYPGGYGTVYFFGGVFILIMAGLGYSGARRSGFYGMGTNRFAIPGAEPIIQMLHQNLPYELPGSAWLGLAGLLKVYAGPISVALAGICNILIGISLGTG